jgi:NADPH2:quinone reductase
VGARVMFTGAYGVFENGTYSEYLAVRKESLSLVPRTSTMSRRRDFLWPT